MKFNQILLFLVLQFILINSSYSHTPYRQWELFRKTHLLILTSHSDLEADAVGEVWAKILQKKLPKSKAMVSRARDVRRVASLLKTDQFKLAILSYSHANNMSKGKYPFEEFNPIDLKILIDNGKQLLITRGNLPIEHGYLITSTLLKDASTLKLFVPENGKFGINLHPGALEALKTIK